MSTAIRESVEYVPPGGRSFRESARSFRTVFETMAAAMPQATVPELVASADAATWCRPDESLVLSVAVRERPIKKQGEAPC